MAGYPRLISQGSKAAYWEVAEGVFNATPSADLPPSGAAGYADLAALKRLKGEPLESQAPTMQSNPQGLPRHIVLTWNGKPVLDGYASHTMAHEIARHFIAGNFAGREHAAYVESTFGGAALAELNHARPELMAEWRDETGRATARIGEA